MPSQVYEFAFVCCSIASVALLVWDHIVCFGAEVRRIWSRKFSGATILYSLLRYGTLLEKITIMVLASWDMTPHGCNVAVRFQIFPYILRTIGFGLFSSLRVYALMGSDWRLASFVFLLCLPSAINPSYTYAHQWSPGVDRYGCQLSYNASQEVHERLRVSGIVGDILSESIVICVTVLKTFSLRKSIADDGQNAKNRPGLAGLFLRDGTIYFIVLLVFSLADMLVLVFDHIPQSVIGYDYWVVPYFTPVFRTIIICRFMLMLKAVYFAQEDEEHKTLESMRYGTRSRVAGSMGATLDTTMNFDDDAEEEDEIVYARDPFAASMTVASGSGSEKGKGKEKEKDRESTSSVGLEEFPWATGIGQA